MKLEIGLLKIAQLQGGFMDKHALPNRPPTAFAGTTGLRLAPPGLLQVARWKHLTETPAVNNPKPAPSHADEGN